MSATPGSTVGKDSTAAIDVAAGANLTGAELFGIDRGGGAVGAGGAFGIEKEGVAAGRAEVAGTEAEGGGIFIGAAGETELEMDGRGVMLFGTPEIGDPEVGGEAGFGPVVLFCRAKLVVLDTSFFSMTRNGASRSPLFPNRSGTSWEISTRH